MQSFDYSGACHILGTRGASQALIVCRVCVGDGISVYPSQLFAGPPLTIRDSENQAENANEVVADVIERSGTSPLPRLDLLFALLDI